MWQQCPLLSSSFYLCVLSYAMVDKNDYLPGLYMSQTTVIHLGLDNLFIMPVSVCMRVFVFAKVSLYLV